MKCYENREPFITFLGKILTQISDGVKKILVVSHSEEKGKIKATTAGE